MLTPADPSPPIRRENPQVRRVVCLQLAAAATRPVWATRAGPPSGGPVRLTPERTYRSRLLPPYIQVPGVLSTTIISEQWLDFVQPHVKSTIAADTDLGIGPAIGPARRAGRLHNNKKILLCLGPVAQKCLGPVVHKQQIPRPRARPRAVTTINCFFQYNNIYKFAY